MAAQPALLVKATGQITSSFTTEALVARGRITFTTDPTVLRTRHMLGEVIFSNSRTET